MKKIQEIQAIIIIEILFQFLSKLNKDAKTMCSYSCIAYVNAPKWWKAWIEVFNLNIKDLSTDELFKVANKICDYAVIANYIAKSTNAYIREEYFQCLVLIIIKTEKLSLENIIFLYDRIGRGDWNTEVEKVKENIIKTIKDRENITRTLIHTASSCENGIGRH